MKKFIVNFLNEDFNVVDVLIKLGLPWGFVSIIYQAVFPELGNPGVFRNYIPGIVFLVIVILAWINEFRVYKVSMKPRKEKEPEKVISEPWSDVIE